VARGELLEDELDARCPDRDVVGHDLADLGRPVAGNATRVVDLQGLGPWEGQVEPIRDRLRERPPAESEHPRAFDPAMADERDIGRGAADIDEQRADLAYLIVIEDAGNG